MRNRLKVLRAERNWSQADLADRLEVSRQSVNAIETGKYDPSLPLAFNCIDGRALDPSRLRDEDQLRSERGICRCNRLRDHEFRCLRTHCLPQADGGMRAKMDFSRWRFLA